MSYEGKAGWATVFPTAGGPVQETEGRVTRTRRKGRSGRKRPSARSRAPKQLKLTLAGAKPKAASVRASGRAGLGERLALGASKEAAQETVRRIVPRLSPRVTKRLAAARARATIGEARKLVGAGIGKAAALARSPVTRAVAARALGIGVAAGLASYQATTAILNAIKDRKERKQAAAAAAAAAYRQSRLEAAAQLGRGLNADEQRTLAAKFKAELARIGYKP